MNQRILIYMPFANWVPHLATDLEIAAKHIDAGDEVHVITCSGNLPTCEPNPTHKKNVCKQCISKCKKGLDILGIPQTNRHPMLWYIPETILPISFSNIDELKQYEYKNTDIGLSVVSSLVSMLRESQPDTLLFKKYIYNSLVMSIGIYNMIERYLKNINPSIFYLFNGRFAPLRPALRAAQHAGVKTFTHERNANNVNEYWLCEDTYIHNIEYQKQQIEKLWNNNPSDYEKMYIGASWFKKQHGKPDTGWYSFSKTQQKNKLPSEFNPEQHNISFFVSSEDEYVGIQEFVSNIYKNQSIGIKQILNSKINDNIHIYIKTHPNLIGIDNTQTRELNKLSFQNVTIIPADSNVDTYSLLKSSDKIISFVSTTAIEALYYRIPSIVIGRGFFEDLGCYRPKTHTEVMSLINDMNLKPSNIFGAYKYGYWQSTLGTPFEYYKPYSIRGGSFKGINLGNPIFDNLKDRFIKNKLSKPILRIIKQHRIKKWS